MKVTGRGSTVRGHADIGGQALIKPRRVGQVGAGNPRNRSNEGHATAAVSIFESHLELPAPAWLNSPTEPASRLTMFSFVPRCQGWCESQKNTGIDSAR